MGIVAVAWRMRTPTNSLSPSDPQVGSTSVEARGGSIAAGRDIHNPTIYNQFFEPPAQPQGLRHNRPRLMLRFAGRQTELKELHAMLQGEGAAAISGVAAWGHGGVGKSALAIAYSYQYADTYPPTRIRAASAS
jgi:hypothetical protein